MASKLIPNTFQYPNWYADHLDHFLTAEEQAVLKKAIREILGWHNRIESRKARIALSIFVDGKFRRDTGERLAWGCGLSKGAVRKALTALHKFGILIKCGDATQDGQLFRIEDDADKIDLDGLQTRYDAQRAKNSARTEKGRGVLSDNRGTVGQKGGGTVGQDKGVLSDNHKETQGNPRETQHVATATPAQDDAKKPKPCEACGTPTTSGTTANGRCENCRNGYTFGELPADATDEPPAKYNCRICFDFTHIDEFGVCAQCYQQMENGERCADCEKLTATTPDMPDVHEVCTCKQEATLSEHFGDPPERPKREPPPHWTQVAQEPWATWGAQSDEFQRGLRQYREAGRSVQLLGYEWEQLTQLAPDWTNKSEVKSWSSGLWACLKATGGDASIVLSATRKAIQDGLTISKPYSVVEVSRALCAERKRGKPKPKVTPMLDQSGLDKPNPLSRR